MALIAAAVIIAGLVVSVVVLPEWLAPASVSKPAVPGRTMTPTPLPEQRSGWIAAQSSASLGRSDGWLQRHTAGGAPSPER